MKQAIYVFQTDGRVKVGISNFPSRRLAQLRSQDNDLSFAYAASTNGYSATELELRAHSILRAHRLHGEWFAVDCKSAVAAVLQAADELGFSLRERGLYDEEDGLDAVDSEALTVRLPRELITAIDDARRKSELIPTRPEMIRVAVAYWARHNGFLKP